VAVATAADAATIPDDVAQTLWIVGGHEFSPDARRLTVYAMAALCPGRQVLSERCKASYENELAYQYIIDPKRDVTAGNKRIVAWSEHGADGLDAMLGSAYAELMDMLRYDLAARSTEPVYPSSRRHALAGRRGVTVSKRDGGDRAWVRIHRGGALHSIPVFERPAMRMR
jgi:hypothetical protein